MTENVHIDLGHPDVVGQLRDVNRASTKPGATYITVPDWVRSLPVASRSGDCRVNTKLLQQEPA